MSATKGEIEALTDRVNTLERANRRLGHAVLCVALLLGAALAVGMTRRGVIEAPAFEVVDRNGETRARLGVDGLTFTDTAGDFLLAMGGFHDIDE